MSDKPPESAKGKRWKSQTFVTTKTPEQVEADAELQKQYADEFAITLEVYFALRGVRDPVKQAAMKAYTRVRKATADAFDSIFQSF